MDDDRAPDACTADLVASLRARIAELERAKAELSIFKTISDRATYGAATATLDGRLVYVNEAFAAMHGYAPAELIGRHLSVLHTPQQMSRVQALNERLSRTGSYSAEEVWHRHRTGRVFPTLMNGTVLTNASGRPAYIAATAIDISATKRDEKLLRVQRDLGLALSSTSTLTEALDHFLRAALRVEELDCGGVYLVQESTGDLHLAIARNLSAEFVRAVSFFPADSPPARFVHAGKPAYLRYEELPLPDELRGLEKLQAAVVIPIHHAGRVIAAVNLASRTHDRLPASVRDALEGLASRLGGVVVRIKAQEALGKSEELFRTVVDVSQDAMISIRRDGTVVLFNPAAEAMFGRRRGDVCGRRIEVLFPRQVQRMLRTRIDELLAAQARTGHPSPTFEAEGLRADGTRFPVELSLSAGWRGGARFVLAIVRDISERRRAEEALRRREALLQAVRFAAERLLAGPSWRAVADEVLAHLGAASEVCRAYIFENHRGDDGALLTSQRHEWVAPGVSPQIGNPALQNVPWRASGFGRWETTLSRGDVICGNVATFPDAERHLLEVQDIRSLAVVPVFAARQWWGLIGFDECRHERAWSAAEIELLRAAASTLGAAISRERTEQSVRESEERYRTLVESLADGVSLVADEKIVYASPSLGRIFGRPADEIIGRNLFEFMPQEAADKIRQRTAAIMAGQQPPPTTYETTRADGTRAYLEVFSTGIRYAGAPAVLSVVRDITERRRAAEEQACLREQLCEAQKMQAVGQVAAGLAHDFGNLLAVVRSGLRTLQGEKLSPSARQTLRAVAVAVEEAATSTESLLVFSRRLPAARVVLDLGTLVNEVAPVLRHLLPPSVRLRVEVAPGGNHWVNADPAQMRQVLLNLALNARDALPEGGEVEIRVDAAPARGAQCDQVRLTVQDTGAGIPPELRERVFEPFFTTKGAGRGTGLGLPTVRSIVHDHGGRLELASEVGHGTTFTILLPGITVPATAAGKPAPAPAGGGQAVLLIEPNRHVRRLITSALRAWDYEVIAPTGQTWRTDALDRQAGPLALAILNVDGCAAAALDWIRRIRARGHRLPIVLTGRSFGPEVESQRDARTVLLHKPFQMAELGACLTGLLEQRDTPGR